MKTFIKATLVAAALLISASASAQLPISLGVKAGMNLANVTGDLDDTDAKVGFHAGVTVDVALPSNLYLMSGLELTTKGFKVEEKYDGDKYEMKTNAMYLQLPVHIGYKLDVAPGSKLVFHAGPYLAYGIGGKTKVTETEDGITEEAKGDTFDVFKEFDFGLGFGVGFEVSKFSVGLGCDFGLTNVLDVKIEDDYGKKASIKNQNAYLSVGYKF